MAVAELEKKGWHLNKKHVAKLLETKEDVDTITEKILDIDLRDVGAALLKEDINEGKVNCIETPCVLQLQNLRVVSVPSDYEEKEELLAEPKICRLSVTDGHVTCSAVTLETVAGLNQNTPHGSKLLLSGEVEVDSTFLLLTNKNTKYLGGHVDSPAVVLETKQDVNVETDSETTAASVEVKTGPPPFVPFGEKIAANLLPPKENDTFRSLNRTKAVKKVPECEAEFQQLRQAAIKEAYEARYSTRAPGRDQFASNRGSGPNYGPGGYRTGREGHDSGSYGNRNSNTMYRNSHPEYGGRGGYMHPHISAPFPYRLPHFSPPWPGSGGRGCYGTSYGAPGSAPYSCGPGASYSCDSYGPAGDANSCGFSPGSDGIFYPGPDGGGFGPSACGAYHSGGNYGPYKSNSYGPSGGPYKSNNYGPSGGPYKSNNYGPNGGPYKSNNYGPDRGGSRAYNSNYGHGGRRYSDQYNQAQHYHQPSRQRPH